MSRVSFIVPVFNRAATLARCYESVRAQTFTDWELIAVDDCSSDDSVQVLESMGDSRIRILRHEVNRGAGAARNTGMQVATGEFVAFLDSDDAWLPEKTARQISALEASGAGLALCDFEEISQGGVREVHRLPVDTDWKTHLHATCGVRGGTTPLFRRYCLERVGLMDEDLRVLEDWDWLLRFAREYPVVVVSEVLARAYAGGPRNAKIVAKCTLAFLRKHDADFRRVGEAHRRSVRAKHFENVASNAFDARHFALGSQFLFRSFREQPAQNPFRLGALFLAPIDHLFGTALIQRAAALQRSLFHPPSDEGRLQKFLFLSSYAHLVLDPREARVAGGAELQIALLARELVRRGHEVVIVSGDHGQPDDRVLDGVRTRVGGKFQTGALADTVRALPRVYGIIRRELPDYVMVCGWTSWLLFLLGARIFESRIGYICGSDAEVDGRYRRDHPVRGALFELGVRLCDDRFAMSEHQRGLFQEAGLACGLFRNLVLPRTNEPKGVKDIDLLWISRCQALKQPFIFLDLAEELPGARCTMICPPEDRALWEKLKERATTLSNLAFIESVPYREVQEYYDRSKIVVNTSQYEGVPNSFIQAGQGRAAIASFVVDPDHLITHFQAGCVAGGEFDRFVGQCRELLENPAKLQRAQKGAERFVHEWHSNERNVDAFLAGLPK